MCLQEFLIALGGNMPSDQGAPALTLRAALRHIEEAGARIFAVSRFYETPCFPAGAGPDYVNAAARIGYSGTAEALLDLLHGIEAEFGRARVQRWGQRTLDLDLLAAGDAVLPDPSAQAAWRSLPIERQMQEAPGELILPHPRMQDRAFVLVPLADVAPGWRHPVLDMTVAEMLSKLPTDEVDSVVPL